MRKDAAKWTVIALVNVALWTAFCFTRPTSAQPQAGKPPFSNSVAQRNDMIRELREIKQLLKSQNSLMRENMKAQK